MALFCVLCPTERFHLVGFCQLLGVRGVVFVVRAAASRAAVFSNLTPIPLKVISLRSHERIESLNGGKSDCCDMRLALFALFEG